MKEDIEKAIKDILNTPPLPKDTITKNGRQYFKKGKNYTRVTSVINVINKPQLNSWRERTILEYFRDNIINEFMAGEIKTALDINRIANRAKQEPYRIMKEAAGKGKFIHRIMNEINDGVDYNLKLLPEPIYYGVSSALKFMKDIGFKSKACEETLFCDKYAIAGTPDNIGIATKWNNALTVLDYKSGGVWPTSKLQGATYRYLWWVKTGEWPEKIVMLQLSMEEIKYTMYWQDMTKGELDYTWKVYLYCLMIMGWMK